MTTRTARPETARERRRATDDRGEVAAFLVKTVLILVVIGVLLVDVGSPVVTRVGLDNDAQNVADDAVAALVATNYDVEAARIQVEQALSGKSVKLLSFEITQDQTVKVRVEKRARSLVAGNINAFKKYYRVKAWGEAQLK